jgi:ABC-type sugar transport system ATPase subunit
MSTEAPAAAIPNALLAMRGIGKRFGGVPVLQDVDFDLAPGEVHVLAGENGAGKSTLVKILAGEHTVYDGAIALDGEAVRFRSPHDARRQGIAVIYQELSLVGPMSVAENMFLGRERTGARGMILRAVQEREARQALREFGLEIDVRAPAEDYPVGVQQIVEIARAVREEGRIVVMDEPTSALGGPEAERLFGVIARLKDRGCGIVYITHRLEEVSRLADRITVLRDGRRVATEKAADLPPAEMIRLMVGRPFVAAAAAETRARGEVRLAVCGCSHRTAGGSVSPPVTFEVQAGEVLGIAGLQGSGASELLMALFGGYGRPVAGEVRMDGEPVSPGTPAEALAHGIAMLTADRKATGVIPELGLDANITLASLRRYSRWGMIDGNLERAAVRTRVEALRIRSAGLSQPVAELSGGNQQKALLARWIETGPRVLLLDEPTRGVDVGVKVEVHELLGRLASGGTAVVAVSSELQELTALADRVLVMRRGRIVAEFPGRTATEAAIRAAELEAGMA